MIATLDGLRLLSRLVGGLDVSAPGCSIGTMPTFLHKAVRDDARSQS